MNTRLTTALVLFLAFQAVLAEETPSIPSVDRAMLATSRLHTKIPRNLWTVTSLLPQTPASPRASGPVDQCVDYVHSLGREQCAPAPDIRPRWLSPDPKCRTDHLGPGSREPAR